MKPAVEAPSHRTPKGLKWGPSCSFEASLEVFHDLFDNNQYAVLDEMIKSGQKRTWWQYRHNVRWGGPVVLSQEFGAQSKPKHWSSLL